MLCTNKVFDHVLAHHFVLAPARQLCRLDVPLVHQSIGIDAKNGSVGGVNKSGEILDHTLQLCCSKWQQVAASYE